MSWVVLVGLVAALGVALLAVLLRRRELAVLRKTLGAKQRAAEIGAAKAELQHPVVDLTLCVGCGSCVRACPEEGVLDLVHGQAAVVRGAHCVGTAACERECPTGAITVTLADAAERDDIPVLEETLEAVGAPGLFLAGEVTAHALIKTAVDHGAAVATEVAQRVAAGVEYEGEFDLVIVGAGPAGLACALEAKSRGLRFVIVDQESAPGGTVAKYPRAKLVMSQPVTMPIYGRFKQTSYLKEELIELWARMVEEQDLPLHLGVVYEGLQRREDGGFDVYAGGQVIRGRHVCLAIGRRGSPNRLGVPGEDLPKVAYSLLDAASYQHRRIAVVGGGDSAVEAAVGLAEQEGNRVTLVYRREAIFRCKPKNERLLQAAVQAGRVELCLNAQPTEIRPDSLELEVRGAHGAERRSLPNDQVFVMAGGTPPVAQLEASGVSFDPSLRPPQAALGEQGSGLVRALAGGFALSLGALVFAFLFRDYYALEAWQRPEHPLHDTLRPGLGWGLWFGIGATVLIAVNLAYLLRRDPRFRLRLGSLQTWMTVHVLTGILALLAALLHGAMAPGGSVGGQAFWLLVLLLATGGVGRYLYAYVPRAANGRELELSEIRARLATVTTGFDGGDRRFGDHARGEVDALIHRQQWGKSLPARVLGVFSAEVGLHALLKRLRREGTEAGLAADQVEETVALVKRAHRAALMVAHYEDLRGVLAGWRYLHRWAALLLVALVVLHVAFALLYSARYFGGGLT